MIGPPNAKNNYIANVVMRDSRELAKPKTVTWKYFIYLMSEYPKVLPLTKKEKKNGSNRGLLKVIIQK
jgi:hypothetical protein